MTPETNQRPSERGLDCSTQEPRLQPCGTPARLLSVKQLASATDESVSVWRKRIRQRDIPFIRCSRNIRVRLADFEAWLQARVVDCHAAPSSSSAEPGGVPCTEK